MCAPSLKAEEICYYFSLFVTLKFSLWERGELLIDLKVVEAMGSEGLQYLHSLDILRNIFMVYTFTSSI